MQVQHVDVAALQIQQELKQTTLIITHNITEAVQLSDRIFVMTYRPGKLKRMVQIDLPRPRNLDSRETPEFGRYAKRIRGMLEALGLLKGQP